jgi:hypothetical protein
MSGIYSVQQIKFDILAYVKEFSRHWTDWYIGVTDDPQAALFGKHGLDRDQDIWLYKQAVSFAACRNVQKYYIETHNMDGELASSGTADTDCVYLYKKSERSTP